MIGAPKSNAKEDQKGNPPPRPRQSVIVRVLRAFKRQIDRSARYGQKNQSTHEINEQMMATWSRRVGLFTGALVVVGIVTAIIFWRQLSVMQGQLDAMERDQRPDLMLTDKHSQPYFQAVNDALGKAGLGELLWNVEYTNFGKGRAVSVKADWFMRLEDGPFKRPRDQTGPGFSGDMPPGKINFGTISSGLLLKTYADDLLHRDLAIGFLIEFFYKDLIGNRYETDVCLSRYSSGAMAIQDPETCKSAIEQ